MSQESFPRPSFLNPKLKTEGINYTGNGNDENRKFYQGSSTKVCQLEEVNPETAKQIPKGFVLKQYMFTESNMFWSWISSDEQNNSGNENKKVRTFPEIASKLQSNHRKINLAFSEKMPDLILPTNYIVGEDINGEQHIYELQPKVNVIDLDWEPHSEFEKYIKNGELPRKRKLLILQGKTYIPESIKQLVKSWAEKINTANPESKNKLKKELSEFVTLARNMPEKLGFIPYDLAWFPNVAFTKEGLRIIDTNIVRNINSISDLNQYTRILNIWQMLAEAL